MAGVKPNRNLLIIVLLALALVGFAVRNQSGGGGPDTAAPDGVRESTGSTSAVAADRPIDSETDPAPSERFSDLPIVTVDELPIEAVETLLLISDGGPYPFDRDDLIFQNREGLLPGRAPGHYREYTVITPDEDDRGARRVVAGGDGELYYTADHYGSFWEITDP